MGSKEIMLTVSKSEVFNEVSQMTDYAGVKQEQDPALTDPAASERIATVDEDEELLVRFWDESRVDLCQGLIGLLDQELFNPEEHYGVGLKVSQSFDNGLLGSMQISLFNFFVHGIAGRWYAYTNKKESGESLVKAKGFLEDIRRKAVFKRKPTRPSFGGGTRNS